uniref:Uncharacterized protein n=1 Tax=Macrostomum lignano TaxID=282301 RepID=A0A1I8HR76_9PLAT
MNKNVSINNIVSPQHQSLSRSARTASPPQPAGVFPPAAGTSATRQLFDLFMVCKTPLGKVSLQPFEQESVAQIEVRAVGTLPEQIHSTSSQKIRNSLTVRLQRQQQRRSDTVCERHDWARMMRPASWSRRRHNKSLGRDRPVRRYSFVAERAPRPLVTRAGPSASRSRRCTAERS